MEKELSEIPKLLPAAGCGVLTSEAVLTVRVMRREPSALSQTISITEKCISDVSEGDGRKGSVRMRNKSPGLWERKTTQEE